MRFWLSVSALSVTVFFASGRAMQRPVVPVQARRANELTLAGLRPGRDTAAAAILKYKKPWKAGSDSTEYSWNDGCGRESLYAMVGQSGTIQELRVTKEPEGSKVECPKPIRSPWRTGKNLTVEDPAKRVVALYGEPDSRSPSTKDGQQLELLYYAFDWAGPDVPQVMEVLCTVAKDGNPGRVVEITLAAPSL